MSESHYVQGWLLGTDGSKGHLVPFELAVAHGRGKVTSSGPIIEDLIESFQLCRWTSMLLLETIGVRLPVLDYHLNFPLLNIESTGVSCRLAFVAAILEVLGADVKFPSEQTVFTGNISLNGHVLPIDGLEVKVQLSNPSISLNDKLVVAKLQTRVLDSAYRIAHVSELLTNQAIVLGNE